MAECSEYVPLDLEDAIKRSAAVIEVFESRGVDVIRIGLCASENLSDRDTYYAGPNHSALGELVENEIFYGRIQKELLKYNFENGSGAVVFVPKGALSKAIGQNKKNKLRLIAEFSLSRMDFHESDDLTGYSVRCEERKNQCI